MLSFGKSLVKMSSPRGRIETLVSTEVPDKTGTFEHLHKVTGVNTNHADQNYKASFGSLFPNSSSNSILSSNPNPQHIHILMPTLTTAPESVMILVSPHDPVGQTQLSV